MFAIREFVGSTPGPRLLITGGVHGDEFEPIAAIQRLIARFSEKSELNGTLTLVPIVNEAAFLRGHRVAAEDGLDLARTFPGRVDGSLTERVADQLAGMIQQSDFYIDLHTGGTEISVLPMSGYMLHSNESVLAKQRAMARAFGLPFVWGTSAGLDGRSMSAARDANVPALYAEYLGAATCSDAGIEAYFEGCLNVMSAIGMLTDFTPKPVGEIEVVEDNSEASGHMQLCHPAPFAGLFHPAVALGESVSENAILGTVVDFTGETSGNVVAEKSGRVVVLRTFPRVREGDSCGVIA